MGSNFMGVYKSLQTYSLRGLLHICDMLMTNQLFCWEGGVLGIPVCVVHCSVNGKIPIWFAPKYHKMCSINIYKTLSIYSLYYYMQLICVCNLNIFLHAT